MVHVDIGPRLNCHLCNKTLKHEASLNHHLRVQHGIYQSKDAVVNVDVQIKEENQTLNFHRAEQQQRSVAENP